MIIIKIQGGLGNQLFQYALGRNIAYLNNTILKLDIRGYFNQNSIDTPRKFGLDHFQTKKEIASDLDIKKICSNGIDNSILQSIKGLFTHSNPPNYFQEKTPNFDPSVLSIPDNSYLNGYWGSEKYFKNIESIIREDLKIKTPLIDKNLKYSEKIASCESVSLHIRRGDYVNNPKTQEFHGNCTLQYYYDAVNLLTSKIENPHFFVFSDDCAWAKHNLKLDFPIFFIDFNGEENDFEDLRLMSLCKSHIIANSTFSWWGAWLSTNNSKIIICPKRWLNKPEVFPNIYPDSWIRL